MKKYNIKTTDVELLKKWYYLMTLGRRHSHARLAHGGGGRDRVAALQRKARAASFRHPRVPL